MDISNQMLEAVANAKKQAKSAEKQFDFVAEMVNIKSSSSIDLFGGRAVGQVADIASSVRKACDELYASYQSLVLMLDQQCRPLLSLNPSTRAVKEVMEMIKWLNKESEIGSNFSGSLNGSSLGDLVNVKYFASMECQMIQKHWENVYSTMPGTEEVDQAFRQRQMEEQRAVRKTEHEEKLQRWEYEQQERERECQEREEELRKRVERNTAYSDTTKARREYLKPAQGMISVNSNSCAFVKTDGTVDVFQKFHPSNGTPGDTSQFEDIKALVCTYDGIVGLRRNGTCIATNPGRSSGSRILEVNHWSDICELAAGDHHVVGLLSNGTCVSTSNEWNSGCGNNDETAVSNWSDIIAIACGNSYTIGLKSDGTVVYAGTDEARDVKYWENIELIAAGERGAVGVTRAGEVVSAGKIHINTMERAEKIIRLGATGDHAYALQADGTLVGGRAKGNSTPGKTVVTNHVIAIATGQGLLVLKEDGCVQGYGINSAIKKIPEEYRLFDNYDAYLKKKIAAEEARKQREQQQKVYRDAGVCQHCGGTFKKSLFSSKCSQCGKK